MIKLLIGVLIIACIAPLFIKGPDGEPIMSLDDWKIELPESLDDLFGSRQSASTPEVPAPSEPTTVYKWQDEKGQWHFSSMPPEVETAETMELDGNINTMDAFVPPPKEETTVATGIDTGGMPAGPMTVSPNQLKQTMETVTNLQETIDQRKADIDKVAGFED